MKNFKKIASIVLALVMVFALTSIAFAAGDGKITVTNPAKDQSYTIYEMFKLETYDNDLGAYRYSVVPAWNDFVTGDGAEYVAYDSTIGSVKWIKAAATLNRDDYDSDEAYQAALDLANDAIVAEFAQKALEYAKNPVNGVSAVETKKAAEGATSVEFTGLELGYYLVDSSLGVLCALTTTHTEAEVNEKNTEPSLDKEVQEDLDGSWGKKNDADIGEDVNFKITVHAKKGAEDYIVHDTMSNGLTFNNDVVVKVGGTAIANTNYTVSVRANGDEMDCNTCTFEVAFTNEYLATLTGDTDIVIEYTAKLNENAVVAGDGNDNKAHLEYNNEAETKDKETKTFTWQFDVEKYTTKDGANIKLDGAEFELYAGESATGNAIKFSYDDTTKVYTVDPNGTVTKITAGMVAIKGLDSGKYTLKETKAPKGYNIMTETVTVEIVADRTTYPAKITHSVNGAGDAVKVAENALHEGSTHVVSIENNTGVELPSTGGIGTTIFYVVGGLLLAAAVILLVTRRRMATAK